VPAAPSPAPAPELLDVGPKRHKPGGCVYTAQGFEFDYVGVIFGRDLRWDPATNTWIGDPSHSHDSIVKRSGDRFTDLVKRTYRVLLTRGLKGCYAYFEDEATLRHVAGMLTR